MYMYVASLNAFTSRARAARPGWSYSCFANKKVVCLSSLFCACAGRDYHGHLLCPCEVWERGYGVAAGWFELAD